jgi:hypothetical protein
MRKIWLALVGGAAIIPAPAVAQSSVIECAKESGGIQIITSDRRQFRWYFPSDMLTARFNDCVARRAALAPQPSTKTPSKRSR